MKIGVPKWASPERMQEINFSRQERRAKRWKHLNDPENRKKAMAKVKLRHFLGDTKVLHEQQHKAIAMLSDFIACHSMDYIAGQCGVTIQKLHRWRNDPFFIKELDKEITRRRSIFRMEAHRQLFKYIKKGKPQLLLAYLKMTGDFSEKVEHTHKTVDEKDETELDEEIEMLEVELDSLRGQQESTES